MPKKCFLSAAMLGLVLLTCGCGQMSPTFSTLPATEEDWYTEYIALILSVRVIDDVTEKHVSSSTPLKKLHSEGAPVKRSRHYLPPSEENEAEEKDDVKEYKKPDTNKYSANRRF